MLYLDRVAFIKRTVKREFLIMSTWSSEDIKKRIEDKDWSHGVGRGTIEPCLNIADPTMAEQHLTESIRSSEI